MALGFEILASCPVTRARTAVLSLPHAQTATPTFMPVATQASMKGLTARQLSELEPRVSLILNNTYHLGLRPGTAVLDSFPRAGASHAFQAWDRNLLTDSGGFQMVSLCVVAHPRLQLGTESCVPASRSRTC